MKHFLYMLLALTLATGINAQETIDIDLWQNGLPNTNGIDSTQPYDDNKRNFKPCIRVFLPAADKANGKAVVACPGGGYSHLAMAHEGYDWAEYFNEQGIALIVLKYRMPHGNWEVPVSDAREALRIVREKSKEWNIDPAKVGIMGSSAGGHLASTVVTHSDPATAPAFQILFYPVITLDLSLTHKGTRNGIVGNTPTEDMVNLFSNEQQVTSQTPPAIMLLSDDDKVVPSQNSIRYYLALQRNNVKSSLHIYPHGGHGWGYRSNFAFHNEMLADLTAWLKTLK